jgi:hypothetical protein
MAKTTAVTLYRPDGGTTLYVNDVDVTSYSKDTIEFDKRVENGDQVTVTTYTSNLRYVIVESVTGSKDLL